MAIVKISDLPMVDEPVQGTDLFVVVQDNVTKKAFASDIQTYVGFEEVQTASAGQNVFTLTTMTYAAGANNLQVFVDGVNQYEGSSYQELDNNTVMFSQGLHQGALVKFSTVQTQTSEVANAAAVVYNPAGVDAVPTNVQDKLRETVSIKDFGAVGDDSTDDTAAIQDCADYCAANDKAIFIPAGIYKVISAINIASSIYGQGPAVSVIKNYGTGDCLDLNGVTYYNTFENFSVDGSGNASSRDGISLSDGSGNPAYCHFFNVYSQYNGRHGLYHRMAWATRYSQCKFSYNGGLGVYCNTVVGVDAGTANCVTFLQCDSRHNGGTTSGFGSDFGGVKIRGAAGVSWIGGVIESNSGYGAYIGDAPGGSATRNVSFRQTYMEYNGWEAAIGAAFYVTGPWANVIIEDCWIAYGAQSGNTNYLFYVTETLDNGNFVERDNIYVPLGTGTNVKYAGNQFSSPRPSTNTAPIVYAYQNVATTLSVANATATKVPLNVKAWDSNNNYNTTTYRFTPTVAGYYRFNAKVNGFPDGGTTFYISIFQNGVEFYRGQTLDTTNITAPSAVVDCLALANGTTDYFELFIFQNSGMSQSYTPGFAQSAMQINFVKNT